MKFLKPIEHKMNNWLNFRKMSLKNRLWVLQILLTFTLLLCIYSLLIVTGIITAFNDNSHILLKKQLDNSAKELSQKYSEISTNSVDLAGKINKNIEKSLSVEGLTTSDIKSHPQLLELILGNEVEKSILAMQKTGVSGVFVFLDATVNPDLSRALDSKAGFYIIDLDPNIMPFSSNALFLHYGSSAVARKNGMYLHTEWGLEYDTGIQREKSATNFYNIPFAAAVRNKGARLQDLGYWSPFFKSADNSEIAMVFSVPLIDKNGLPYGVCGLEISRTFFDKIMPPPVSPIFDHMILLFSTSDSNRISMKNAAFISDNSGWLPQYGCEYLLSTAIPDDRDNYKYYYFEPSNRNSIIGLDTNVSLYPSKTVFKDQKWILAALVPTKDVKKTSQVYLIFTIFSGLFILGIVVSYYTSWRYIEPIVNTFNKIKEYGPPPNKTNIPEIDDFIEFLMKYPYESSEYIQADENMIHSVDTSITTLASFELAESQFEEFTKRFNTLSKAEREVFDLYIKGHTAKEISQMLYVSINTVKSHNKKIYSKMNVNSRVELLSYCYKLMGKDLEQNR